MVIKCIQPILYKSQIVRVKEAAESRYNEWIQKELDKLIFNRAPDGSKGWYINRDTNYNATIYPSYQWQYWFSTLWPKWSDFTLTTSSKA